jgi:hypothetical protein
MPEQDWGITIFTVAAIMFVFAMQFTYMGLMYAASPSERVDWMPRILGREPDEPAYMDAAKVQDKDFKLQKRYFTRASMLYNVGILSYTGGLAMILVPRTWTVPRGFAVAILGAAFVLEAIWTIAERTRRRPQWLVPGYRSLVDKRDL